MPFDWIDSFLQSMQKSEHYAEKTLAAYRLGMKAGGSIRGVSVRVGQDACEAARSLPAGAVYHPDDAPRLPLPGCSQGGACHCVYRPVMSYDRGPEDASPDEEGQA